MHRSSWGTAVPAHGPLLASPGAPGHAAISRVLGFVLAALVACAPVGARAQSEAPASPDDVLRSAGKGRFRVISRFGAQPEQAPAASPNIAPQAPGPAAVLPPMALSPELREALEAENWSRARQLLKPSDQERVPLHEGFLHAYVHYKAGDERAAEALLAPLVRRLAAQSHPLSDYIHHHAALVAQALNKPHEAVLLSAQVPSDSLLYSEALVLLVRNLQELGQPSDLTRAQAIADEYLKLFGERRDAAAMRMVRARNLEGQNQREAAASDYLAVCQRFGQSGHAETAYKRLQALGPQLGPKWRAELESLASLRQLQRLEAIFEQHKSQQVIQEAPPILERWAKGSGPRCEALLLVGRSYTKLRDHGASGRWYDRVVEECPAGEVRLRALYLGGRAWWNADANSKGRALFERVWKEYPEHSYADDAMYFASRTLRDAGQMAEARALLRQQVARYPQGDMAKDAHWLLVREMFESRAHEEVVRYVDGLAQTGEDDLYSRGRLHYFRARALQLAGRQKDAVAGLRRVIQSHPKSYYALLAFNQLSEGSAQAVVGARFSDACQASALAECELLGPSGQPWAAIAVPEELARDRGFARSQTLVQIGLGGLAQRELLNLRTRHAGHPATLWALAAMLDSLGVYPLSHDIPRRGIENWVQGYPDATNRRQWEVAYPRPFAPLVEQFARQRNLPQALVFAIMREESGFNPRIESWANARGLLQLMEDTARMVARAEGISLGGAQQLFEPQTNVRLATAFMAQLAAQNRAHPALIIAGYNGGQGNVSKWLSERGHLPLDLWVEDIPFGQTRNYTKRVLSSYWTYAQLYGEMRAPRLAFGLK